jgi:outer membrane protein OmpA-like peptidoglycan-associated protein
LFTRIAKHNTNAKIISIMARKSFIPILLLLVVMGYGCSDPTVSLFVRKDTTAPYKREKRVEIEIGDSAVVGWKAENAEELSVSNLFATRKIKDPSEDSSRVSPAPSLPGPKVETYTYIATATDGDKVARDTAYVVVKVPPPPKVSLTVSPEKINTRRGEKATLKWNVSGALAGKVTISGVGDVDTVGEVSVNPAESQQYTLSATGKGGTTSGSASLIVEVLELQNLLFGFDKADVDPAAQAQVKRNTDSLGTLLNDSNLEVVIEGHSDVRGGDAYNYDLAAKRANNAWQFLADELNLKEKYKQFKVVSYGEAKANYKPRVPDAYPSNDSEYQADRNVTFVPLKNGKRTDDGKAYSATKGKGYKTASKSPKYLEHKN